MSPTISKPKATPSTARATDPHGLHLALTHAYDLMILDLMLPGIDGYQLCQRLREAGSEVPIIMLTARDTLEDRLQGLKAGADDYLVAPSGDRQTLCQTIATDNSQCRLSTERRERWCVNRRSPAASSSPSRC
jgi:DNA-binding response OmpR family regulator